MRRRAVALGIAGLLTFAAVSKSLAFVSGTVDHGFWLDSPPLLSLTIAVELLLSLALVAKYRPRPIWAIATLVLFSFTAFHILAATEYFDIQSCGCLGLIEIPHLYFALINGTLFTALTVAGPQDAGEVKYAEGLGMLFRCLAFICIFPIVGSWLIDMLATD